MSGDDLIEVRETIAEVRAALSQAVKIDAGRRAMEGDVEDADIRLQEAQDALDRGDVAWARGAVAEARTLLESEESRLIVEDAAALEDALRLIGRIRLD